MKSGHRGQSAASLAAGRAAAAAVASSSTGAASSSSPVKAERPPRAPQSHASSGGLGSSGKPSSGHGRRDPAGVVAAAGPSASGTSAAERSDANGSDEVPELNGVPTGLQSWWLRTDPGNLERETMRSGRCDMLAQVSGRLKKDDRVLDLGCGPGLLAREAGRRDIMGVDMSPAMLQAARQWMDLVVPDNILEHFPTEPLDAVVLCNVLEPYPTQVRGVLFRHCHDFLRTGGRVIVVVALFGSSTASSGLDMLFPPCHGGAASPEELEDEMESAGLELTSTEIVDVKTVDYTAAMPGEEPRTHRHSYALLVGRKE